MDRWLPRITVFGGLSKDEPLILPPSKVIVAVSFEAEKGARSDISLEGVVLGKDGKTLAHVNEKEPSISDGAFQIFFRKETVPIQVGDAPAEGDAPAADGDAPPADDPPADPPAADPPAEEEAPTDDNQPPKPKPADWESIPDRLHLDLAAMSAEQNALVVNLVSKSNFQRGHSATVRLFIGHLELGRASFPLRGEHAACALLYFTRDPLTQALGAYVGGLTGATCDAAMKAVHTKIDSQPKPSHSADLTEDAALGKLRRERFAAQSVRDAAATEGQTLRKRLVELVDLIEKQATVVAETRVSSEATAAQQKADGDEDGTVETMKKAEDEEAKLKKLEEESEAVQAAFVAKRQEISAHTSAVNDLLHKERAHIDATREAKLARRLAEPAITSKLERTLAIIKPDAVPHAEAITDMIRANGFLVAAQKRIRLSVDDAALFYKEHEGKPFYTKLTEYMSSGDIVVLMLAKTDAIRDWRALMGPTNVDRARSEAPDSIRGLYATDTTRNAVHGSDSLASAQRELRFFFQDVLGPLDTPEAGREFITAAVQPTLVQALTALCKQKPADPLLWLADWLQQHNPSAPSVLSAQ